MGKSPVIVEHTTSRSCKSRWPDDNDDEESSFVLRNATLGSANSLFAAAGVSRSARRDAILSDVAKCDKRATQAAKELKNFIDVVSRGVTLSFYHARSTAVTLLWSSTVDRTIRSCKKG